MTTAAILRAVTKLENGGGVQLLEMEESFGWAGAVQRNGRIPVVVRIHGPRFLVGPVSGIPQDAAFRRRVRNEGRAIESAAGVSCPSQSVLDQVRSHYGLALANAEVIPNPIAPVPVADRWRIGHCRPDRILFVGRFDRCKGGDLIIEAFAKVVRQHPQAHLTFVGPDRELVDDLGRPWRAEELIRRRIPDPVSRSHVDYLGYLPAPEINRLRQGCFLTVVCSRFENFPNVALEGMAFGCPLVLSDVGGLPEIVQHEQNGLLCRSGDAEDLADKILRLLRDRALAARLARQAASDAEQRYHPQVIAERTLEFYRRVIERANSKQRDRCRRW